MNSNAAELPGSAPGAETAAVRSSWEALWTELQRLIGEDRPQSAESGQLAAAILMNMETGLLVINSKGQITECNPAAQTVLGQTNLVGRDYRGVFWPNGPSSSQPPPGVTAMEECLRQGRAVRRLQLTYQAPAGQNLVLGVGFSPIRAARGHVAGAICLLTDLTEINALQQQIRLKENLAALGEMSAGIAHEFKNSLATISGYSQMIEIVGPDEGKVFARKIHNETRFLARIVNDFLNLSRPLQLAAAPVHIGDLVDECFKEVKERGAFPDVTLEMDGEFPVTEVDSTLLRKAFANLLLNGCEAILEAGGSGRLRVRARREAGKNGPVARLEFQDDGPGISPENLERVFIPFFTTKDAGTGLGLALVHKIIVHHNGTIRAESAPGQGATFVLTLPLVHG